MIRWLSLLTIVLSLFLMGCSTETTTKPTVDRSNTPVQGSANLGQTLPITAQAVVPNGTKIDLEVASTPEQQAKGLMYRSALPNNRGMLFKFPSAQPVQFWMKNVPVALDMVFLQNGVVKYIQAAAPPCATEPCPTYGPNVPIDTVIELRAGRASELKLQPGDKVTIRFLKASNLQK